MLELTPNYLLPRESGENESSAVGRSDSKMLIAKIDARGKAERHAAFESINLGK